MAGQKQVCEAAVLSEKNGGDHGSVTGERKIRDRIQQKNLQTGAEDFLNIKAFHLQEVGKRALQIWRKRAVSFADALKSLIREKSH